MDNPNFNNFVSITVNTDNIKKSFDSLEQENFKIREEIKNNKIKFEKFEESFSQHNYVENFRFLGLENKVFSIFETLDSYQLKILEIDKKNILLDSVNIYFFIFKENYFN